MLPEHTTVLIVGAGPTGLAAAISLVNHGCRDIVVVDAVMQGENTSRAMGIHAATLESLDALGCAEPLVELGIRGNGINFNSRSSSFITTDFTYLKPYTRFPYVLLCPQSTTEKVLEQKLKDLGVEVFRPHKVVGLHSSQNSDGLEVLFESGELLRSKYVIGADGAKSVIRDMSGVSFADPDGHPLDENIAQLVLADITFSTPKPSGIPVDTVTGYSSPEGFYFIVPLPTSSGPAHDVPTDETAYRIGFNIPVSLGPPPSHPSIAYLQDHLNNRGPVYLSSDPVVNPNPVHISKIIWSTRFRTHSAIADKFVVSIEGRNGHDGGIVMLVGDAAHIHSPVGGQGMNLGIRDAVGLGSVISQHMTNSSSLQGDGVRDVKILEEYASARRDRALNTIRLTKRLMVGTGTLMSTNVINVLYWVLKLVGKVPFITNRLVWRLSGLGNR